jgi:uncharacterized RDD family membrane protein YckC
MLLLRGRELPARWTEETTLVFAHAQEHEVRDLIASIEGAEVDPADATSLELDPPDQPSEQPDDDRAEVATPARRLLGYVVDSVLSTIVLGVVYRASHAHGFVPSSVRWGTIAIFAVYQIAGVALWGRTVGKLVARTVVVTEAGEVPGWRRSVVRWAVQSIALAASALGRLAPLVALPLGIVVYAGLFNSPLRQGLHDRLAGTVVVRAD